jgi:hypothetical protein
LQQYYENSNIVAEMQSLTEHVFHLSPPGGLFDETVVRTLYPEHRTGALRALIHRATRPGEVLRLKPGLYCLDAALRKTHPHPFVVAAALHWPSHVSLESALSFHRLIPEAAQSVASVTARRSRSYATPLGTFTFTRIPMNDPMAGVRAVKLDRREWAFVASPIRAIADLLYIRKREIEDSGALDFLIGSMRIEREDLVALSWDETDEVLESLRSKKIRRLIEGLRERIAP